MKKKQLLLGLFIFGILTLIPFFHVHAQETEDTSGMTAGEAYDLLMQSYRDEQGTNTQNVVTDTFDDTSYNLKETTEMDDTTLDPIDLPPNEQYRAKVLQILDEKTEEPYEGYKEYIQTVQLKILNGKEKGSLVTAENGGLAGVDQSFIKVKTGDVVVLYKSYMIDGSVEYSIADHYRLWPLFIIILAFFGLAIWFGRWKGFGSILGLAFSLFVIVKFIVPKIITGGSPLTITLIGTIIIASVSLFLAHGFNKRTLISFISTLSTLVITLGLSEIFVRLAYLSGMGSEEAFYLQFGQTAQIDLRGLLLAGIVIGTLGVLDDITTAQTAVVGELKEANDTLSRTELYHRGLIVGREHISSLVNTLVLAYAGASLPLFILFVTNNNGALWATINSQMIAEEIVRTVIGSASLILAVPIATFFAAYFLKNEKNKMHF